MRASTTDDNEAYSDLGARIDPFIYVAILSSSARIPIPAKLTPNVDNMSPALEAVSETTNLTLWKTDCKKIFAAL